MAMVERVAQALEEVYASATDKNPDTWERYARAAIEAMREPTPQMVGVGWAKQESGDNNPAEIEASYRAMIDAALNTSEG